MISNHYQQRVHIEARIIYKYFKQFKLIEDREMSFMGWYTTQTRQKRYKIKLTLPLGYPDQTPKLNVIHPIKLFKRNSINEIDSSTHAFHTLSKSTDGYLTICHYPPDNWHAARTCFAVLQKAILWLESYEIYLETGDSIDTTLKKIHAALVKNNKPLIEKNEDILNISELLNNFPDSDN